MTPSAAHPNTAWSISDMADMLNVTPRALRFYEDKGLIHPQRINGQRSYGLRERARMDNILRGKRLGFSLDDIRTVLDIYDGKVLSREELLRRKNGFEQLIEDLKTQRDDIDIVTENLSSLCARIDAFANDPARDAATFMNAQAYDAVLRRYLDDELFDEPAVSAARI
ncbi:MerR family transcriptional regulator [Robiginitomaculum antarcticum]|uniref:MerR family transcriptional regulator n=1 Tax=Robiginitomaculum antarcticum TaxID=437507 RepID=UPI00036E9BD8|nr:MerR family DNA-binding transcriptional regulator [Robiginitomaculum antarcticum]